MNNIRASNQTAQLIDLYETNTSFTQSGNAHLYVQLPILSIALTANNNHEGYFMSYRPFEASKTIPPLYASVWLYTGDSSSTPRWVRRDYSWRRSCLIHMAFPVLWLAYLFLFIFCFFNFAFLVLHVFCRPMWYLRSR